MTSMTSFTTSNPLIVDTLLLYSLKRPFRTSRIVQWHPVRHRLALHLDTCDAQFLSSSRNQPTSPERDTQATADAPTRGPRRRAPRRLEDARGA